MAFMIPVGRRDLGVLMQQTGGKNQRAAQLSAKDASILSASKPAGNVRPAMASSRPRSLVYNVRKQQHIKMTGGMPSNPDLQWNSVRSPLHNLNGYHASSQPTSPVKQSSMKSCGASTGSLPINAESSPVLNKQTEMGSLRKFQRQLVDRFRRSIRFRFDDIKNVHMKQGNSIS